MHNFFLPKSETKCVIVMPEGGEYFKVVREVLRVILTSLMTIMIVSNAK